MTPIHPIIVHFPIALLISSSAFAVLAIIIKSKRDRFIEFTIWNLAFGLSGAVLAVLSGLNEIKTLFHNDDIHSLLETHKLLGFIVSGIFLFLLIWLTIRKVKMNENEFLVIVILLIISSGILSYSAHLGGQMVYKYGAGVLPMEEVINSQSHDHNHNEEHQNHDNHNH